MSVQTVCDRCATLPPTADVRHFDIDTVYPVVVATGELAEFDLCASCARDLRAWIEAG